MLGDADKILDYFGGSPCIRTKSACGRWRCTSGQENTNLAILDPSGRSTVLPAYARRMQAFLQKSDLIDHQHVIILLQRIDDIVGPAKSIFNNHVTQIAAIGNVGLAQSDPKSRLRCTQHRLQRIADYTLQPATVHPVVRL